MFRSHPLLHQVVHINLELQDSGHSVLRLGELLVALYEDDGVDDEDGLLLFPFVEGYHIPKCLNVQVLPPSVELELMRSWLRVASGCS